MTRLIKGDKKIPEHLALLDSIRKELCDIGIKLDFVSEAVYGKSRKPEVVFFRVIISLFLHHKKTTLHRIGIFINRDHSSVNFYLNRWTPTRENKEDYFLFKERILNSKSEVTSHDMLIDYHKKEIERLTLLKNKKDGEE